MQIEEVIMINSLSHHRGFPAEASLDSYFRRRKPSHYYGVMQGGASLPDLFTFLVYQTKYRV